MIIPTTITIIIIVYHFTSNLAFCHINEATSIQKHMMLYGQPNSAILITNMISKYSKLRGISESQIKVCIENKKKIINDTKKNKLRGIKHV